MKYCHGNDDSFRFKRLHNRPYMNLVGRRSDGRWSVGWMLIQRHANQLIDGAPDIEAIVCRDCGFIFQGVVY